MYSLSSFLVDLRDKYAYILDNLELEDEDIQKICASVEAFNHQIIKDER